jgi:ferritin
MLVSLLSPEVKALLQKAVEHELFASHLYKSFANQSQRWGWFNAQKFFTKESADELIHYQILQDYFNDRNDCADIPSIEAVTDRIASLGDAIRIAYETELNLLNFYVDAYEASEDKYMDCVTSQFLLQFIEIQRKAVGEFSDLFAYWNSIEMNKNIEMDKFFHEQNEV